MDEPTREHSLWIAPWEFELIKKVARRFETTDREELEAELAQTVLQLKANPPKHVRNWTGFLAKALLNRASTWVKRWRRARSMLGMVDRQENPPTLHLRQNKPAGTEDSDDLRLAFVELRRELGPHLWHAWEVLFEEKGNQAAAARRLRVHRNTLRLWIRKIQRALKRYGF